MRRILIAWLSALALLAAPTVATAQVTQPPAAASGGGTTVTPSYVVNNWYTPFVGRTVAASATFTPAGHLKLYPFLVYRTLTISNLAVSIGTAASGGNLQLSIYANNATTSRPTTTPVAGCSISTTTTGTISCASSQGSGVAVPGLYWMAVEPDTTAGSVVTVATMDLGINQSSTLVGASTAANAMPASGGVSSFVIDVSRTFSSGVYPDLTSATFAEFTGVAGVVVAFKLSAVS